MIEVKHLFPVSGLNISKALKNGGHLKGGLAQRISSLQNPELLQMALMFSLMFYYEPLHMWFNFSNG